MIEPCPFCDRTKFEERIIAEDDDWYIIATLGQITDGGYVLVIPKNHVPCLAALSGDRYGCSARSLDEITKKVCRALYAEYLSAAPGVPYPATVFEHGIVGQTVKHAHLHFLPVGINLTSKIRADFPGAEFQELRDDRQLQTLYQQHPRPYLYWSVPGGKSIVCWDPPAATQYLRVMTAKLLGRPERANWRQMDPDLDKRLWQETIIRLKPYFF